MASGVLNGTAKDILLRAAGDGVRIRGLYHGVIDSLLDKGLIDARYDGSFYNVTLTDEGRKAIGLKVANHG